MPETTVRAPTLDDADAVVSLVNAEAARLTGSSDTEVDAAEVRGWWTQPPPYDPVRDACLAVRDGRITGYGDMSDWAHDGTVFWLDVRGPGAVELLPELERRAATRAAPDGVVRAMSDSRDETLAQALADRGYVTVRASYRMAIEIEGETLSPALPAGARIRTARPDEDRLLHDLSDRSFAGHWGFVPQPIEEWLHGLRSIGESDPTLWYVAEVDDEAAGIALCRPTMHGNADGGWVSILGVLPGFRRGGLGTALLAHAFAEFRRRGKTRVGLGVDAENTTGAVGLYERAGMHVVRRWDMWEKPA